MAVTTQQLETLIVETENLVSEFPRVNLDPLNWPIAVIEDYDAKGRNINLLLNDVVLLAEAIQDLTPLTGTATPEGNVTSNRSKQYYRIDGPTTEIYFNNTIGTNTGWTLISAS